VGSTAEATQAGCVFSAGISHSDISEDCRQSGSDNSDGDDDNRSHTRIRPRRSATAEGPREHAVSVQILSTIVHSCRPAK